MKFTQIKKICKEENECVIYEEGPMQWIGTKSAAYPVEDVRVTREAVKTLFDWPDVEADISVGEMPLFAAGMMPDSVLRADVVVQQWQKLEQGISVYSAGERLWSFIHAGAVMFLKEDKIKPAIRKGEYQAFTLTYNRQGQPLIVISNGLMVTGIVRPEGQRTAEAIMETMQKMSRMIPTGTPMDTKEQEEDIDGQIAMDEMLEEHEDGREDGAAGSDTPDA